MYTYVYNINFVCRLYNDNAYWNMGYDIYSLHDPPVLLQLQ